ncbi:S-adenosyl-L-methionine-dependent methyltransferase [Clohesyomyces aquaticus]|uniref:S-adenosyl-L-methionine-dependent methyltransferase n=1 Tax=Clohesyomyces aquaticus TaxID=1231657 RepID=A0A1Y2A7V6_9PLEO|nr:S-adenosyl-L-methionine-dependent methyltransferase [Clohesyomyces aquaticus]
MNTNTFVPKQCPPRSPLILDAIQGDVTKQIATYAFSLAPPIIPTSIIHDNACGTGAITEVISSGPHPSKLHATDLNPAFTRLVAGKAQQNGWTWVETAPMDCLDLTFPENYFTHSITSFCLQVVPDAGRAVEQIYRSVKKGGTAIITTWSPVPHADAVENANALTRGNGTVLPMGLPPERQTTEWVEGLLKGAGFASVQVSQHAGYCKTDDLKAWCANLWSFVGVQARGWTQKDEDTWDQAVAEMVRHLKSNPDVESGEDGGAVIKMVANVAVATK